MKEQDVKGYLRRKKGGKRKCVSVSGYKRKIQKAEDQEDV